MKEKRKRRLKVYSQSNGYNYHEIPAIVLKGKWLEAAGFKVGTYYDVVIENDQLVIKTAGNPGK